MRADSQSVQYRDKSTHNCRNAGFGMGFGRFFAGDCWSNRASWLLSARSSAMSAFRDMSNPLIDGSRKSNQACRHEGAG